MLPIVRLARGAMRKRIAVFSDLEGGTGGHPAEGMPGYDRTVYNVLGSQASTGTKVKGVVVVPLGFTPPAIDEPAGFRLAYVECTPGNGVPNHVHDTNETFVVISGRWRFQWGPLAEGADPDNQAELGPLDVISVPAGVPRRFVNLEAPAEPPGQGARLLAVVAGDAPANENTADALEEIRRFRASQ
jgi:mannose-6-phosphate isomerase-like protein (cupin superfamily)